MVLGSMSHGPCTLADSRPALTAGSILIALEHPHCRMQARRYQAVLLEGIASTGGSVSLIHSHTRRPRSLFRLRASP